VVNALLALVTFTRIFVLSFVKLSLPSRVTVIANDGRLMDLAFAV